MPDAGDALVERLRSYCRGLPVRPEQETGLARLREAMADPMPTAQGGTVAPRPGLRDRVRGWLDRLSPAGRRRLWAGALLALAVPTSVLVAADNGPALQMPTVIVGAGQGPLPSAAVRFLQHAGAEVLASPVGLAALPASAAVIFDGCPSSIAPALLAEVAEAGHPLLSYGCGMVDFNAAVHGPLEVGWLTAGVDQAEHLTPAEARAFIQSMMARQLRQDRQADNNRAGNGALGIYARFGRCGTSLGREFSEGALGQAGGGGRGTSWREGPTPTVSGMEFATAAIRRINRVSARPGAMC